MRKLYINYILIILLALISFSIYINSLSGDFIIDDQSGILNNERIHDIRLYFSKYFKVRPGALYEIMQVFLWHISGGIPYYFHLFNIIAHTGCVVLLFILCQALFNNRALSFLSSLIFAVHPIHAEAVSWISGGHYALSSLFFIAAFLFYVKSDKYFVYLFLSVVFFSLCLFAGYAAATLPIMFIFYELFFKKIQGGAVRKFRLCVLFLMAAIALLFIGIVFVKRDKFMHLIFYYRGLSYLIVDAKALVYYLKILYLPLARGLFHPFAFNTFYIQKISPAFFLAIGILLIAAASFFKCRRNNAAISFGIAWFFICYAPYSNIIPVCNIISERYLYLPSAGFSVIMAALFLKVWEIINRALGYKALLRAIAVASVTLFLSSYAFLTLKHNYEYANMPTYWETNIRNFPDGYVVYNNLAATFYAMGDIKNAMNYCLINLNINPRQPHVWCNLGKLCRETGDLKKAADCYRQALEIDKHYFPAHQALNEIEKQLTIKEK